MIVGLTEKVHLSSPVVCFHHLLTGPPHVCLSASTCCGALKHLSGEQESAVECVCVCCLQRDLCVCVCVEWVGASVRALALCTALLLAEWKHHVSVGRPEEQPCFSTLRPKLDAWTH